jgi:3-hydroxyacyl-CoA dehydrogenase/enoyl-CoA hydratase/3-hydroxybutyryl-CoA epimerase
MADPVAANMTNTLFIRKGEADRLARRPAGVPKSKVATLGVLGAGMMGAGIACAAARAGMEVRLLDVDLDRAEHGKRHGAEVLARDVERGRLTEPEAARILSRIRPTTAYGDLAPCELVIEAVFEDRAIKADVTRKAEAAIASSALFASNTSTLPITGLAEVSMRPAQFIGLHFFSPVERMPLVEIIVGAKTDEATLARGLDFVAQLRKTPIVVNDRRGFFASRVFATFTNEGLTLLGEGVQPALIENAARMAGMPIGPLAVLDEVSLELASRIEAQTRVDLGPDYVEPSGWAVMRRMVEDHQRLGKRHGQGFYEYPADAPKRLWRGLVQAFPLAAAQPDVEEVKTRILYIQALEAARCMEENVLRHAADADLGSILGVGYPAWTGGTLSFIDTIGIEAFVAECDRLAQRHGPRFAPSAWLRDRAAKGLRFH